MSGIPTPTDPYRIQQAELHRWSRAYAGDEYLYGSDPGPVARRTVRYHVPRPQHPTALDLGCGEGQDLAFLAEEGYRVTGVEFVPDAVRKSRRLLESRGLSGEVVEEDLCTFLGVEPAGPPPGHWDLVLAVNTLQFTGELAERCLERTMEVVAPGGILGLSLFAREPGDPERVGTVALFPAHEILDRFRGWQRLEAANLWQWNPAADRAQAFVTMIARRRA